MITYKNFHCFSKCRKNQKGAVAVEVCFLFPFLVWITFCILQYGYIMWKEIQLTNLSRDAMRYLSCTGVKNGTGDYAAASADPNSVYLYVQNAANGTSLAPADIKVKIFDYTLNKQIAVNQTQNLPAAGDRVGITLTYTMSTGNTIFLNGLVPGMSIWLNNPPHRETQMMMEWPLS